MGDDETEAEEEDILTILMKSIQQLNTKVEELQKTALTTAKAPKCWGCQKEGHTRNKCTTHPWPKKEQSGNGNGSQ